MPREKGVTLKIGQRGVIPGFPQALPIQGLLGGLMIGLAAAIMLLGLGRIAGVSGLAARATGLADTGAPRGVAMAFIIGLPLGALVVSIVSGGVVARFPASPLPLIIGGLLVGFGTRLGSGCTSGHGACGMSRLSRRSITATIVFMGTGFATVASLRAGGLLQTAQSLPWWQVCCLAQGWLYLEWLTLRGFRPFWICSASGTRPSPSSWAERWCRWQLRG